MPDYDELAELGFTEKAPPKKRKSAPPKKGPKPAPKKEIAAAPVVVDNKEIAAAMERQNQIMKEELKKLVTKIEPRPKKMRVNIHRNSAGFMDSFDIDVEY